MNKQKDDELVPFDPEIERTCRRNCKQQRAKLHLDMAEQGAVNEAGNNLNVVINVADQGAANAIVMADDRERTIRAYAAPMFNELNPGIVRPQIQAQQFELKPVMFQMLQTMGQFSGQATEDPHLHLRSFLEVSGSFKLQGVPDEALRLRLFPYSLRDRARAWLNSLPSDSISTWDELAEKFLMKYFPPTKNAKFRNEIISFQQLEDESVSETWERFKELLRKCPHHGIPHCIQMETFYNGLNSSTRMVLDASANGAILAKSYNEAYEILERIANNNCQWSSARVPTGKKLAGIHEVDALTAQVASMGNMLKNLSLGGIPSQPSVGNQNVAEVSCVYCAEAHAFESCPSNPASVCYMGNQNGNHNNPYSNSYNPGWKQHPNFSWGGQGSSSSGEQMQNKQNYPLGFMHQQQQMNHPEATQSTSLEVLIKEYMAKIDAVIQCQAASLRSLEVQVGQLTNELKNRAYGTLPSDTENPRKGKEQCNAVTLRSGKDLVLNEGKLKSKSEPTSIQKDVEQGDEVGTSKLSSADSAHDAAAIPQQPVTEQLSAKPPPPFPRRFQKQQQDAQFRRFLDVLKQLHINIPLVEALEQMPTYVKFLKDILTKKRRFGEFETVALMEGSSALLKSKIPTKLKDPGSFTIPCSIEGRDVGRALCDLGASINLMPLSIFKKLGIGEARPTTLTLQLADRSMAYPEGKIEDVLVQVDKFIFPADFIILDYEADWEVPIILGRPFLATGRTLIDVEKGELTMRVNDEQVTFNAFNAMKLPDEIEECCAINVVGDIVAEKSNMRICGNHRKKIFPKELEEMSDDEEAQITWASKQGITQFGRQFESLVPSEKYFKLPKPSTSTPHVAAQISSPHYSQLMIAFSEIQSRLLSYWAYVAEHDVAQRSKANKTFPIFPSEILEQWSTPTEDAAPTSSDESEE